MDNTTENATDENFGIVLNEQPLDDNHPVYGDYLYVCDGKVIRCNLLEGTVRDMKRDLFHYHKMEVKVVTSCDIYGRKAIIEARENKAKETLEKHL